MVGKDRKSGNISRITRQILVECHIPDGYQSFLSDLGIFVSHTDYIADSSTPDRFCDLATGFVVALAEEVHLVYRSVRGSGEEHAFGDIP